ncbi:hypothetical protein CEXT_447871 [Caerostris extrusa]|uniref:Uncharacterized protein n=1 Tax=Caerostris extrusa TaxID=172846 RepID=A0AAV4V9Q3_CAEEX|nr:hypothetical protein CEXT_447871 [Caerostris extrusa]
MEFKETLIMIYVPLVGLFPNDQNRFRQRISATSVIGTSPNIWPRYATPGQGDQSYLSFSVKMKPDESCPWRYLLRPWNSNPRACSLRVRNVRMFR